MGPEKRASLVRRFWLYQRERFPLAAYAPLTGVFTCSAAAYSRRLRAESGSVGWELLAAGTATTLVFFFLLRVLDEHKDAAADRRWRPELPVPRGLVTLPELRGIAVAATACVLALNLLLAPVLLQACVLVALWAALMTREFFVGAWLRERPAAYLGSHMLIMPLIDGYTTGLDWMVAGARPALGLWLFLTVTFLNGTVMEIGRKIRAPEGEREGVQTYSRAWGVRGAPAVWLAVLLAAAVTTWLAARCAGAGPVTGGIVTAAFLAAALPGLAFLRKPAPAAAKRLEAVSGLWVLVTYLLLGFGPAAALPDGSLLTRAEPGSGGVLE